MSDERARVSTVAQAHSQMHVVSQLQFLPLALCMTTPPMRVLTFWCVMFE